MVSNLNRIRSNPSSFLTFSQDCHLLAKQEKDSCSLVYFKYCLLLFFQCMKQEKLQKLDILQQSHQSQAHTVSLLFWVVVSHLMLSWWRSHIYLPWHRVNLVQEHKVVISSSLSLSTLLLCHFISEMLK